MSLGRSQFTNCHGNTEEIPEAHRIICEMRPAMGSRNENYAANTSKYCSELWASRVFADVQHLLDQKTTEAMPNQHKRLFSKTIGFEMCEKFGGAVNEWHATAEPCRWFGVVIS